MIAFFCFYDYSTGIQSKLAFSKTFKHCNIITFDGTCYLAFELSSVGIETRKIKTNGSVQLIRGLKYIDSLTAIVVVNVDRKASIRWKPYVVRSCNELNRYISGVDIGFTFNPKHLYNKLFSNNNNGYEILYAWRR